MKFEGNENEVKGLLKKLHGIMKSVGYLQKDKKNEKGGNYTYASERVIKTAIHKEFAEKGILCFFEAVAEPKTMDVMTAGGPSKVTTVLFQFTFCDVESAAKMTGTFVGTGNGRDDKGFYASVTGCIKYVLTSAFLIVTGDDPEDSSMDAEETPQATVKKAVSEPAGMIINPYGTPQDVHAELAQMGVISKREVNNAILAFAKLGVTQQEIEKYAQYPIAEWTTAMKALALADFNSIRAGLYTKEQLLDYSMWRASQVKQKAA